MGLLQLLQRTLLMCHSVQVLTICPSFPLLQAIPPRNRRVCIKFSKTIWGTAKKWHGKDFFQPFTPGILTLRLDAKWLCFLLPTAVTLEIPLNQNQNEEDCVLTLYPVTGFLLQSDQCCYGFPLNVPPLLRIVVWLCLKLTVFYFPTWAENWLKEGFIYLRFIKDDFLGPERWLIGWEGLLCKCENLSLNQQYPLLMCSQDFKGRDRQIPRAHWPASVAKWQVSR